MYCYGPIWNLQEHSDYHGGILADEMVGVEVLPGRAPDVWRTGRKAVLIHRSFRLVSCVRLIQGMGKTIQAISIILANRWVIVRLDDVVGPV